MPIVNRLDHNSDVSIGVWRIEEQKDFFLTRFNLTEFDKKEIGRMSAEHKLLQWLASRYLLKVLMDTSDIIYLHKDQYGKPYVDGFNGYVSISHCDDHVAVIVSRKLQAGVDIEKFDNRIERISHRFLKEWERWLLKNDPQKLDKLILYWSAKETLYKWYGKKGLTFKTQLLVNPFDIHSKGTLNARLEKDSDVQTFEIHYRVLEGFVLTYTLGQPLI